jgi:hypothetical protein
MGHRGRALVLDSIEDFHARVDDPDLDVDAQSVLVLRGCGPKGYPGCRPTPVRTWTPRRLERIAGEPRVALTPAARQHTSTQKGGGSDAGSYGGGPGSDAGTAHGRSPGGRVVRVMPEGLVTRSRPSGCMTKVQPRANVFSR